MRAPSPASHSHNITSIKSSFRESVISSSVVFSPGFALPENVHDYLSQNIQNILEDIGYRVNFHNKIKIVFTSTLEKLDKQEIESCEHHSSIPKSDFAPDMLHHWIRHLTNNLSNTKSEKSGWVLKHIHKMLITIYTNERALKRLGRYTSIPTKLRGSTFLLNINTDGNCVHYSLIAYFMIKDGSFDKIRDITNKNHYEKNVGKYFNFPEIEGDTVTIEDFGKIESAVNLNIVLYQLSEINGKCSLKIIRKSTNDPSLECIYLCTLNEENHVVLVKNIQKFIHNATRNSHVKPKQLYCPLCFNTVNGCLKTHEYICRSYMYIQNIVLPDKGETYKFNSHAATEKAGIIVFCDFEASLEKIDSNDGKTISAHRLMAYKFVIINSKDD